MSAAFIKNIGKVRFNGLGADLYENKNGTATIRFDKNCTALPKKTYLCFDDLVKAEAFIESKEGSDGLNTLINILDASEVNY